MGEPRKHCWLRLRFHRWFIVAVLPMSLKCECEECGRSFWWES